METTKTTEPIEAKSQYQHFIPQFILREFAETSASTATDSSTGAASESGAGTGGAAKRRNWNWKDKKRGGGKQSASGEGGNDGQPSAADATAKTVAAMDFGEGDGSEDGRGVAKKEEGEEELQPRKGIDAGIADTEQPLRAHNREENPRNPPIKYFNLETGTIEHNRVACVYGNQDMYRDATASDANHIHKQLSALEQVASRVFNRIKDAQKLGITSVDLTRVELNTIRKFLSIMKYRNQGFWKKYNRPSIAEYIEVDKPYVANFMRQRGFKKPAEVWLCTMKAILDTPIDPQGKWKETVLEKGFEYDALWFIMNMTESYFNFCTPQDPEHDEFIITDNGFGIHEGPTAASPPIDPITGAELAETGKYTEYHKMAPLSPRLLLVLRSNFLRPGHEHALRALRATPDVPDAPSLFEDLRLEAAKPNYGPFSDHGELRDDHVFTFRIQKLSRKWVHLFNTIALAEVDKSITWKSDAAMLRTMRAYLEHPVFRPVPGLEMMQKRGPKEKLFALLGGDATAIPNGITMSDEMMRMVKENPMFAPYFKLGGTPARLMSDMRHSFEITNHLSDSAMRLPQGPQYLRVRNASVRESMIAFSKLPSTTIFWHVKQWRANDMTRKVATAGGNPNPEQIDILAMAGPEDWVAELSGCIQEKHRSRLMLEASIKLFFREMNLESVAKMGLGREISKYIIMDKELDMFKQWGGISSSCFLESYPGIHTNIGAKVMDPHRSKKTESEIPELYINDLKLCRNLRVFEVIENTLCGDGQKEERKILQKLLWEALYWLPQSRAEDLAEMVIEDNVPGCVLA